MKIPHRLPMNSDEGSDFSSIRKGRLATIAGYPKDLMLLMRTLAQEEPSSRPSADRSISASALLPFCLSRLLKNPALDPLAIKSMSQLKRELKEEREKVIVSQESGGSCVCSSANIVQVFDLQSKLNGVNMPAATGRIVGRGTSR